MDKQDIEKQLEESAQRIEVRDFSEVWESIKGRIESPPKAEVRKKKRRWIPAVASVACIAVICSVAIPLALHNGRGATSPAVNNSSIPTSVPDNTSADRYADHTLVSLDVTMEKFEAELRSSQIAYIDLSSLNIVLSSLLVTPEGVAKGGKLDVSSADGSYYMQLRLYDSDVDVDELTAPAYDFNHSVGNTQIDYRLKETIAEYNMYVYEIKTTHKGTQYFIEYTCFTEDIKPFLNTLFA